MGPLPFLVLFFALASCTSVTSLAPVGLTPALLAPGDFEGTWLTDDVAFSLEVAHTNGLLRLSWIEPSPDKGGVPSPPGGKKPAADSLGRIPKAPPRFKSALIEVRRFEDWTIANIQDPDHPERKNWFWALMESAPGELRFRVPEASPFSNLVATGVLPGRFEGGSVVLDRLDSNALGRLRQAAKLPLWGTNELHWRRHGRH